MSAEPIGPGDCVEAVRELRNAYGPNVPAGSRSIVTEVSPGGWAACCGMGRGGIGVVDFPLPPETQATWCVCGWRKIGPGREELTRRFREDLNVGPGLPTTTPERVTA